MKKLLLISILCICTYQQLLAQIPTQNIFSQTQENRENIGFDSTQNFLGNKNVQSYIGQELYVTPRPSLMLEHGTIKGYKRFKTLKFKPSNNKAFTWEDNVYGKQVDRGVTAYNDLVSKVFIVDDLEPFRDGYCFILRDKFNANNRCKFIYEANSPIPPTTDAAPLTSDVFPFYVMAYYEHFVNKFRGRKCVIFNSWLKDINTGNRPEGNYSEWTITDVKLDADNLLSPFQLILTDGNRTAVLWKMYIDTWEEEGIMPMIDIEEWQNIIKERGIQIAECFIFCSVCKGMTLDEVKRSLGRHLHINTSSYATTQYTFEHYYVYIENGIVVDWSSR